MYTLFKSGCLRAVSLCVVCTLILSITGCGAPKPAPVQYSDSYCSFEYDSSMWTVTDDYGENLKTTAVTLEYTKDPMLCNIAFLALPANTLTGEEWLAQVYATVDAEFGCLNKNLTFTKNDDRTTTTLTFEYPNGDIRTSIKGIAQHNDNGVIIGLATINTDAPDQKMLDSLDSMCMSARVNASPSNEDMLDPDGKFTMHSLILSDETAVQVYTFRNGMNSVNNSNAISTYEGLTSEYWLEDYVGDCTERMDQLIAAEVDQLKSVNMLDITPESTETDESGMMVLGQVWYDAPVISKAAEQTSSSEPNSSFESASSSKPDSSSEPASSSEPDSSSELNSSSDPASSSSLEDVVSGIADSLLVESSESSSTTASSSIAASGSSTESSSVPETSDVPESTDVQTRPHMRIYKVSRVSETQILVWRLDVNMMETTSDSSSASIDLMVREGVQITIEGNDAEGSASSNSTNDNSDLLEHAITSEQIYGSSSTNPPTSSTPDTP